MSEINSTEVALYCTGGIVQYAESLKAMMDEYNRNGRIYEVHIDADGNQLLWHKGHNYVVGIIKDLTEGARK